MECKMIQEKILENPDDSTLKEHLEHCPECKAFYEKSLLLEEQLIKTYSENIEFKSCQKTIMKKIYPKRNFRVLLVAALLAVTITITFAEELYLFAEEIPLVGELLRYFVQDEGAESARTNDYLIQDLVFEKDGYKLYVKDLYYDSYHGQFKIALERDGEYLKGFSYGINFDGEDIYWREERNETTPWAEVRFNVPAEEDLVIRVGIRVDKNEVIFDEIIISNEIANSYSPKVIDCNKTIVTDYGELTIENIEIYPTAMYMNTSYDFDESVYMFHLMDFYLVDNNDKKYAEDSISQHLNPEGKQRFRILGTCYDDETVNSLEVSFSTLKIKYFDELVDRSQEDIIGFQFEYVDDYHDNAYTVIDVQRNADETKLKLELSEPDQMVYPLHLAIYSNDGWQIMEKSELENVSLSKHEQTEYLPLYVFSDWLSMDIERIDGLDGKLKVIEQQGEVGPHHKYESQHSRSFTREEVEVLLSGYNIDLSDVNLDYVFKVKSNDIQWFNLVDLEIISGMSLEELKKSNAGKVKLIEHLKEYYVYYDLGFIDHFIDSVIEYGSLGQGGHVRERLKQIQYSGFSDDETIKIGMFKVFQHTLEDVYIFDLK